MAMLFALTCKSQAQEVRLVEKLADDSYVVMIGSVEHRAFKPDKVRELAKQKIDLETCKANESRFNDLITIEKQNVTIATQQRDMERANFVRAMQLFETERALRVEAQTQFIPHGKVGGFGGKVLRAMDSPWFQGFIKAAVPIYTAWQASNK